MTDSDKKDVDFKTPQDIYREIEFQKLDKCWAFKQTLVLVSQLFEDCDEQDRAEILRELREIK